MTVHFSHRLWYFSFTGRETPWESEVHEVISPELCVCVCVCVWIRTTGCSHCVSSVYTPKYAPKKSRHCASHTGRHINTHHISHSGVRSTLPVRLRHKLHTYYVDSTSSDIQHHTGPLCGLIDKIQGRPANIRKTKSIQTPADSRCGCPSLISRPGRD